MMYKLVPFLHPALLARAMLACLAAMPSAPAAAQQCSLGYGNANDAKPNKLYLYFPTVDSIFPEFETSAK
jgi:hypothetical protein